MTDKTTNTQKQLGLYFGGISSTIEHQLRQQKYKFDKSIIDSFQKDADAIIRLRIRGFLTDSVLDKINKKLFNKIEKHVHLMNKPKKS